MTAAQHTPGPWEWHEGEDYVEVFQSRPGQRDKEIINIMQPCAEDVMNACLIAAAPELLWALQNLLNGIDTGLVRLDTDADETLAHAMSKAQSALAKAKGRAA